MYKDKYNFASILWGFLTYSKSYQLFGVTYTFPYAVGSCKYAAT